MLKQRHQSSVLSSKLEKTLSRPKFINKTQQQTNYTFTQGGKQAIKARLGSKNKSCYIPKHLAQSTQSHMVWNKSTSSKNYKSTGKNHSVEAHNKSRGLHNVLNIGSDQISPQNVYTYQVNKAYNGFKPYISFQERSNTANIQNKEFYKQNKNKFAYLNAQNHNESIINNGYSLPVQKNKTSSILHQKLLQKQVKQMFLYKSKQLTKILQQLHRYCLCVKQLKWICQQTHLLIRHYNDQIGLFYQDHFKESIKRSDLQNMLKESQLLLKRFNQLEYLNANDQGVLNFNIFSNKIMHQSSIANEDLTYMNSAQRQNYSNNNKTKSPENLHSWSKLIQNMKHQQNVDIKPFPNHNIQPLISNDQHKNMTIRTFQITEHNSPFKNKTLNQLIKLSQLRKTQFAQNYNSQNKENNKFNANHFINPTSSNQNQINQNHFMKKNNIISQILSKQSSNQKDPFDSIHIPHFNNKNNENNKNNANTIKQMSLQEKKSYENQILNLNKKIQELDKQNNEYFRKLKSKNLELQSLNEDLSKQIQKLKLKNINQRQTTRRIVGRGINQLLKCRKVGKSSQLSLPYQSFDELVYCLEEVLKSASQQSSKQGLNNGNRRDRDNAFTKPKQMPIFSQLNSSNYHNSKSPIINQSSFKQLHHKKQALMKQLQQLDSLKNLAKQEIQKMSQQIDYLNQNINQINNSKKFINTYENSELYQMLFLQAFTIEQILQIEDGDGQEGVLE